MIKISRGQIRKEVLTSNENVLDFSKSWQILSGYMECRVTFVRDFFARMQKDEGWPWENLID